ncbi:MAG: T9SS type A sorting domain-containing protein, partial [Bacteroidia bacterium]|nr:T9SS type A sorting domain-containing protein [Bacteroidia bacterium]
PYTRVWSSASNPSLGSGTFINVNPATTTVYYLTVTDGNGCTAMDSVKVCVFDVRCGNNLSNVLVCHGTGSASNPFITVCVDLAGAKWHLKKHAGEKLGTCGMNKSCLFPIEIRLETWQEFEMGDDGVLLGAFPNPFTNSTTIQFTLPENDFASVKVFDVTGRVIENLYDGATAAGETYSMEFDGSRFTNGIYFLMLNTQSGVTQTRKLILDKY